MRKNIRKAARGFTLIELVIVVAVIAILAALLVPTILGQAEKARLSRAKADTSEVAKAAARMRTDTESNTPECYSFDVLKAAEITAALNTATSCDLPVTAAMPRCADQAIPGMTCWGGPYLSNQATYLDPWGTAYSIVYDATTKAITVSSAGKDRTAANADDISTIQ